MSLVVVERTLDPPRTRAQVLQLQGQTGGCGDAWRVVPVVSYHALDGGRTTCLFHAPDAEAVRTTQRHRGLPFDAAWSCAVFPDSAGPVATAGAPNATVIVERRFPEPIDVHALQAREDAHQWCLETNGVRALLSYVAADGRRILCFYEAPDADAVRRAQERAGMPFERVWSCEPLVAVGAPPAGAPRP